MSSTGKMLTTTAKDMMASCGNEGHLFLGALVAWIIYRAIEEGYVIEGELQGSRFSIHPTC